MRLRHGANAVIGYRFNTNLRHLESSASSAEPHNQVPRCRLTCTCFLLSSSSNLENFYPYSTCMLGTSLLRHVYRYSPTIRQSFIMGKKKAKGEYNDFLEDNRYQNSNEIHSTLQSSSSLTRTISPPGSKSQPHHLGSGPKPKSLQLTHFLCLPLITSVNRPQLDQALVQLRKDVQRLTPVPSKAVRPVGTLHLTLGVMSLSPDKLSEAISHLDELDIGQLLRGITTRMVAEEASEAAANGVSENGGAVANPSITHPYGNIAPPNADPDCLAVQLRGLLPMQKPHQTSILYAEPKDATGRLRRFAESIRGSFEQKGLVLEDSRGLKLHATVLNTIYAKSKGGRRGKPETEGEVVTVPSNEKADKVTSNSEPGVDNKDDTIIRGKANTDSKSWMRFDAEGLIEAYRDFVWADNVRMDRVQICRMGAKKTLDEATGEVVDEQYEVVAEKSL